MKKISFQISYMVIVVMVYSHPVFAFLGDTIGAGIRASSLGEAFVAVADDYSATFYNPAGLGQIEDEIKLTIDWIQPVHTFEVKTLSGGKDLVGLDTLGETAWDPTRTADGGNVDHSRPILGLTTNLTKVFSALSIPFDLTLGVLVMIPNNFKQPYTLSDFIPDIPDFLRFGDTEDQLTVAFSLGVEAIKNQLYLGIGCQSKIQGDGDIHADSASIRRDGAGDYLQFELQIDWRVYGELTPIVGVLYTPFEEKLKIGATYRKENSFDLGPSFLTLPYLSAPVEQRGLFYWYALLGFQFAYSPDSYTFGIAYTFDPFTISLDYEIQTWSDFDYHVTFNQRYSQEEPTLSGYVPNGPELNDVGNICVGLEYRISNVLSLMTGYQHMPTPVPDQTDRITNYLDMDKDLFSIGISYSLKKLKPPHPFKSLPFKVGAMFQYINCNDYKVYKNGDIDGWVYANQESYEVKGDVYVYGISMEITF